MLFLIKFQVDGWRQYANLLKIALLRTSFPHFKIRLIVPKHRKLNVSACRMKISDQLGIFLLVEDTIYSRT